MFKVLFLKQVHSCFATFSTEDLWLQREVELPFPPFEGLSIYDGEVWEATVTEMLWRMDKGAFHAYTEPDKTLYHRAKDRGSPALFDSFPREDVMEAAQPWIDAGWQRRNVPPEVAEEGSHG
jgi:hypothetical protein